MAFLQSTVMRLWSVILVLEIISNQHSSRAAEIGRVKCVTMIDRMEWWKAEGECAKELKGPADDGDNDNKKETFDFSWVETDTLDDFFLYRKNKCSSQCVYEKLGIPVTQNGLPDQKETLNLWAGNTTMHRLELVASIWDACIDFAARLGTDEKWNKCKMVAVHSMCFNRKFYEATEDLQEEC